LGTGGLETSIELLVIFFYETRGHSKRPRSADFLNNVLCVPYVTS